MCSLPFCGRLEAFPACLGMPWWCFDPFKKYFRPLKAPGELRPLSLLFLTMGAPSVLEFKQAVSLPLWAGCTHTSEREQGYRQ